MFNAFVQFAQNRFGFLSKAFNFVDAGSAAFFKRANSSIDYAEFQNPGSCSRRLRCVCSS
jgi:hypothetical protein